MPDSSGGVGLSPITAGRRDGGVWLRRAGSGVAWRRCHLVCHWLQDLRRLWRPVADESLVEGKVGEWSVLGQAVGACCRRCSGVFCRPRVICPELSGQRICGQFTLRTAVPDTRRRLAAASGTEVQSADASNYTRIRCTSPRHGAHVHESDTGCGRRARS
jgi:hypothetical protein